MQIKPAVLIVDYDQNNLSELTRLLSCLDADIVQALSCKQAVEQAQTNDFCVAVIRAEMQIPDSYLLIEQLHSQPLTSRGQTSSALPVILLHSRYPDEAAVRKGYEAGASDIIARPLVAAALISKVRTYLALGEVYQDGNSIADSYHRRKDAQEMFQWLSRSVEQIAFAMATTLDMIEVPNLVLEQLPEVVPYERGSILLCEGDSLRIMAQRGFPPDWPITDARIPIRQGDIFQQIVESRQALLIDDVTQTSAWQQAEGLPVNRSWLGVPLVSKDRVIGMVSLTRREAYGFKPGEILFIRASASQAAVALVNARLLSDLRQFNEQLEQLVQTRTEELKQAYDQLEKIDQTKTSFISVAAHELRTPLTLIKGYTGLLGAFVRDNKEANELLEGILTGQKRLLDIVNSMIDVSRIDSKALDVGKTTVSLWIIIKIIRTEFEAALKERQMTLSIGDVDQLPPIQADSELISKLFRQLIGNAIKYTPDGGSITIRGKYIPRSREDPHDWIELLIRDTGIGIDPAYHELIFDKFYQLGSVALHSSGKTKFKGGGPGLGLAIARGIVQVHGGRIWAESPGHNEETFPGSCFHVLLPVT